MNKRSQRKYTAEEKFKILQEGEYGKMSINEVCRRHRISPNTYYLWRQQAHKAMLAGLNGKRGGPSKKNVNEARLEDEVKRLKNTVVEITQENIDLKKRHFE